MLSNAEWQALRAEWQRKENDALDWVKPYAISEWECFLRNNSERLRSHIDALMAERNALSLEPRISDSEMMSLLRRVNREFQARAEAAEDALRSVASFLGVGGYNAPAVDAALFERKIRAGIDMLTEPLCKERERLIAERDALAARVRELEAACSATKKAIDVCVSAGSTGGAFSRHCLPMLKILKAVESKHG